MLGEREREGMEKVRQLALTTLGVRNDQERSGTALYARDAICFLLRQQGYPYQLIGRFVRRDHSSVIAAVNRVITRMNNSPPYNGIIHRLRAKVLALGPLAELLAEEELDGANSRVRESRQIRQQPPHRPQQL